MYINIYICRITVCRSLFSPTMWILKSRRADVCTYKHAHIYIDIYIYIYTYIYIHMYMYNYSRDVRLIGAQILYTYKNVHIYINIHIYIYIYMHIHIRRITVLRSGASYVPLCSPTMWILKSRRANTLYI